jgi:DNA-binding NarL/FixJ family response regulator
MKSDSTSDAKVISVLIADDHPVVREGLAAIFKTQKDIIIVGEATDGEEALELCNQHSPDVLLLDLRMPKKDGLQVITELAARRLSKPRTIVMTTYESEEDIRRALKAGAKGYLVKGQLLNRSGNRFAQSLPGNHCSQRRSPRNWLNRWPIRSSLSGSAKSWNISQTAAAIRRSGKFSISVRTR